MKKNYLIFIVLISFFNCSKDDSTTPKPTVSSITPTNTFIGDTLTLVGQNLTNLNKITFVNEEINGVYPYSNVANAVTDFISKTDTEIKFVVPELYHEKATVYAVSGEPGIEIELFGFIPYSRPQITSIYRFAEVKQLLNDDIVFLEENDFFNERFKLTNNLTDYSPLPMGNENDYSYYYTSEVSGWILTQGSGYNNYSVYSFTDNINNRNLEYNILYEDINYEFIRQIKYVSNNLAYIMNGEGEMFQVLNGQISSFYDLYPNLDNTPYMSDSYIGNAISFQVLDDNSIIICPRFQNYILRFSGANVDVIYFESNTSNYYPKIGVIEPAFFGNMGAFFSNQKIFKSNDYGLTWNEYNVDITLDQYDGIQFLGGSQFLLHDGSYTNDFSKRHKYISTDDGVSWKLIYSSYDSVMVIDEISDQYGITTFWPFSPYGLVKFRKFPDGF